MEQIGEMIGILVALAISFGIAIVTVLIRRVRRFALAVLFTPPTSLFLLYLCRGAVLDSSPVCGPDPKWDRCPTVAANIFGWAAWAIGTAAIGAGAYWCQRAIGAAAGLWFDSRPKPLSLKR